MKNKKEELTPEQLKRKTYNSLKRKIIKLCKEGSLQVVKNSLEYYQSFELVSLPSKLMDRSETIECYEQSINEYIENL